MNIDTKSFKYLEDQGIELPVLVLGIKPTIKWDSKELVGHQFINPEKWLNIVHQTAGVGCHQFYCQGMILESNLIAKAAIKKIAKKYYDTNIGAMGACLSDIVEYNSYLDGLLGVNCNVNYADFEEGIYPIDIEYLPKLTDQHFPSNLDDLIKFENSFQAMCGCFFRWNIWILGENSD